MKKTMLLILTGFISTIAVDSQAKEKVLEVVRNFTRVKILESNNVGLRPGSIYDNITIFESLWEWPRPGFNYEFIDSGLGAAEPLYPMYQKGHQGSWLQLVPAFFSKKSRHIDHYTSIRTPEGCQVDGLYGLRHISEYPRTMFVKERAEGYEQIVVRLEHYTRLTPDAQCGRHMSHDPDPSFDPMAFVKKHHKAMTFSDFPQPDLDRFEWKLSAIRHMQEERNKKKWPRFDLEKLKHNSLWYYADGHAPDFGIDTPRPQSGLEHLKLPRHLLIESTPLLRESLPLSSLVSPADFTSLGRFLSGQPQPDFDPTKEPGLDTLKLDDVTENNIYTSGLYLERIKNVAADVLNPRNYALVAVTLKPFELNGVPELRFVYQLMDPRKADRPFEQLYLHLRFDIADPAHFLNRLDALVAARENLDPDYENLVLNFVDEFTKTPLESLNFSSSLTGIWVFGSLTRSQSRSGDLEALRIVREGVDLGYYSSTYDNDLFRTAIAQATGARKALLEKHMDDLTVTTYRDPKRNDAHALTFDRVSCAQCHQTAGRDAVHVALNDGLDRRFTSSVRATEFFYRDSDKQLKHESGSGRGDH